MQLVVDFPPGAWTSWHTHGGQAINLVLEGEMTLRHAGMEQGYRAGQAWTDSSTQVHAAGNSGAGKARLLTNFLLPQGAPDTIAVQESPFEPTIVYAARFALTALPLDAQIVQQVVDLGPAWHAERALAGFIANIVLEGEVAYKIGPELKVYKPGQRPGLRELFAAAKNGPLANDRAEIKGSRRRAAGLTRRRCGIRR